MDNFTEMLIEAVRQRPILYDLNHGEYKNNYKKTVAWEELANEIGGENGEVMKDKWRNLRDTYRKHKNALHSGHASKKLKNWLWAPYMEFLDGSTSTLANEEESFNDYTIHTHMHKEEARETSEPNTPTTSNLNDDPEETGARKRKLKSALDKILVYVQQESAKKHETPVEKLDKADYLFLSYADTFKKLTPRRQATLKLDLAKLFAEAELANIDEVDAKHDEPKFRKIHIIHKRDKP